MARKFVLQQRVTHAHLDALKHVNNVQYVYWAQEIAKAHWASITEDLSLETHVWMVRAHQIEYRLGAFENDVLQIETYVDTVRGPLSNRVVDFFNEKTKKRLVRCQTQWCYVNPKTRKPVRIPPEIEWRFLM